MASRCGQAIYRDPALARAAILPWDYSASSFSPLPLPPCAPTFWFFVDDQTDPAVQHAVSSAPNVQPEIDPNYVEDEFDVELLLESMKFIRKVTQQKEWQDVAEMQLMPSPDIDTDEKLRGASPTRFRMLWK